jgi:VanZ family protein
MMRNRRTYILRWTGVVLWMTAIFLVSATPSTELPQFGAMDYVVKKGGHMLAYAILAILILRALEGKSWHYGAAWMLAVLYALVDEFHQSFVPGRHPSLIDAFLFDGGGAAVALLLSAMIAHYTLQHDLHTINRE